MIDALATQPNYATHLAPCWAALPPEQRGRFYVAGGLAEQANRWGIPNWTVGYPQPGTTPVLVAGYSDESVITRPVIYLEHGAGQSYPASPIAAVHPAYSGTPGHERVILFLGPSETVMDRWRAAYPRVPAVAVGCPKLDALHAGADVKVDSLTVAITAHSDNRIDPAAGTAWPHYAEGMPAAVRELQANGWEVLGHGHPRAWKKLRAAWVAMGVEPVEDFGEVLARAAVLAADNTSALPEMASTGRPVVWMDAPWWDRNVTHGGRFWDWPEGQVSVGEANELPEAVIAAHQGVGAQARREMVGRVYVACDGKAAARAAAAIAEFCT